MSAVAARCRQTMSDPHPSLEARISERWGKGVTRRAIGIAPDRQKVAISLADHSHSMACTIHHDGVVVTGIDADFRRYTLNHCPAAVMPLRELIGQPLGLSTADFFAGGRARRNCTHMLDMAWLGMRHAIRSDDMLLYEIEVPDSLTGHFEARLMRNGTDVMAWTIEQGMIVAPERFAGKSLWQGFLRWATREAALSEEDLEHALVLHKGVFMTGSRRAELPTGPINERNKHVLKGACFGYAETRIDEAIGNKGMFHDFTDDRPGLLSFR